MKHSILPELDDLFTRFADCDQHWGPLLFLRPRTSEQLGLSRVFALTTVLGLTFGLLGSIFLAAAARVAERPAIAVHVFPLLMTAVYFLICQSTFVPAWNRRALRLAQRQRG